MLTEINIQVSNGTTERVNAVEFRNIMHNYDAVHLLLCVCVCVRMYMCVCLIVYVVSIMYIIHCMCINKPLVYMYILCLGYVNFYHIWPRLHAHMYMYMCCHGNTRCARVVSMTLWYIKKLPCPCVWGCIETRTRWV